MLGVMDIGIAGSYFNCIWGVVFWNWPMHGAGRIG